MPERDRWGPGPSILDAETLALLRGALAQRPLVVEHGFYRGGSSPARHVFEDADKLEAYLRERTRAGDDIRVWRLDVECRDDTTLARGRVPDVEGNVPAGGAY